MKIEVMYVADCPNHGAALERLREVLPAEDFRAHVREVLVCDAAMALKLKFPGSPTIRVDGQDVEPQSEHGAACGLMCRIYPDGSGVPSRRSLRKAIENARRL
ncbi:MAG: DF family (seleno)protein [Candidatus Acidiferrum sp.]